MKLAIFDPYMPKFTDDMLAWWNKQGHEIRRERYYNPELVEWADVIWFDTCDNNLKMATNPDPEDAETAGWGLDNIDLTNKKIICRVIDIEAWHGHHLNVIWDNIHDVIFIAPHIQQLVEKDIDFKRTNTRVHMIQPGVNLDIFTFRDKPRGTKIAWVCERWASKGIDYALQILALLPEEYTLHALGIWNSLYPWDMPYIEEFLEKNNLKHRFIITDRVHSREDVNDWLEDKDYILSCSKKEAFGYNVAEGMAKGLKPAVHKFYGCDKIWDKYTWYTVTEAVDMITNSNFQPSEYHQYLIDKGYTLEAMMAKFDEVIRG